MSIKLPKPPSNEISGARGLAAIGLCIFAALSVIAPQYLSPLQAFVPAPYFLRTRLASDALPFQIGTVIVYALLCFVAAWKNRKGLAVLMIAAAPAMALLTFLRLMSGGGVSGGI